MNTMKRIANSGLLALAAALFLAQNAFATPAIDHWTQASGAQVYLVQSPGIPMLDVEIDFDAGSRRDPRDKVGLAAVTADMVSAGVQAQGDAPALDENALSEAWADLGASFAAAAGRDRMSFALRTLTFPDLLPKAVQLAARELGAPSFPDAIWQRNRQRLDAALKEADTRPGTIAGRAFDAAVFGDHPYGYDMAAATLSRITVADMQQLYAREIQPCRAKVSLVGAVTREQADALVQTLLAQLPAGEGCAPLPAIPEVLPLTSARDIRIPFDSAQAHVLIGQPGFKRADPDYFALRVGNYILGGGGFASRLSEEVRQKRGLSYSVYSAFSPGLEAGAFTIGLQTRPDQADEALRVARGVLARFVADGPTDVELRAAKDNLIGGFPLLLDSNRKLLGNVANIAWYGLPLDYLDTWTKQVQGVTAAEVRAAFQRKLQPDRMVTVVVGAKP